MTWTKNLGMTSLGGAFFALALTGCSTSGSGVDQEKRGEDLTRQEARDICESLIGRTRDALSEARFCKTEAFLAANRVYDDEGSDAAMQGACEEARSNCGARYEGALRDFDRDNDCRDAEVPDDCRARVGDIEACANERLDAVIERVDSLLGCDEYSRESIDKLRAQWRQEERNPPPPSDACRAVEDDCDDWDDIYDD